MGVEELIQQGIEAGKGGDRAGAVRLLSGAVRDEPGNARAWYLLSQVIEGEDRARYCLERVLEIDPGNERAELRLKDLKEQESPPDLPTPKTVSPPQSREESALEKSLDKYLEREESYARNIHFRETIIALIILVITGFCLWHYLARW